MRAYRKRIIISISVWQNISGEKASITHQQHGMAANVW